MPTGRDLRTEVGDQPQQRVAALEGGGQFRPRLLINRVGVGCGAINRSGQWFLWLGSAQIGQLERRETDLAGQWPRLHWSSTPGFRPAAAGVT
ncbi:MAG: hypothetical protein M3T56_03280 [Chloroflexota bacterium]|nr:hypothetical protein [Chloroflexota bacterium]